mgnify:CR=1 FL=1
MPITFKSQAAGDLVMLQASAEAVLSLLGKTAQEPGILEPKDMPAALAVLKGLPADEPEPAPEPGDIARLTGSWNDDESRAFAEAMEALNSLPDDAPSYMAPPPRKPGE